ncbi:hypothetical protein BGZ61DRAFT_198485 [Ilyonectria robusta]|uniref:uncharacterized protein n=1 Tax=Ilyonectria robusta TaxID=1079257 RepID=UPI001E8EA251|nr:uncharacterized protein BGZ61DRAFT_198485 [Ilyonectria robusta]KAH8722019.1 hypothetical protein BGZ61DRAFT_198485 [Ilyonectria robusta]
MRQHQLQLQHLTTMPNPSNRIPNRSPSPSPFPYTETELDFSACRQMSLSYRLPHGGRDDAGIFAFQQYEDSNNASSSEQPTGADEDYNVPNIDSSANILSRLSQDNLESNSWGPTWANFLEAPNILLPWQGSVPVRKQGITDFLDSLTNVFPGAQTPEPTPAPPRDSAPITPPVSAQAATSTQAATSMQAATSAQGKRTRAGRRAQSDSDDEQYEGQRYNPRRKTVISHSPYLPPPPSTALHTQTDETRPTYPRFIAHAIRELVDEDFEDSCEYCFCYLYEPFKYINKPFTSCGKPRAEVSHILTHAVSDHGLIRGHHSGRKSQRYLTRCASHNAETKGKAACTHCNDVEHWTEEDLANEVHAGESVCTRCYAQLPTKADLFRHLNEPNICVYNEDWAMRKKVRILYSTFCAPNEVPKFQPPPGELRGDGARKRNLKGNRRPSAQPTLTQNNSQNNSQNSNQNKSQATASGARLLSTQPTQGLPHHPRNSPQLPPQLPSPQVPASPLRVVNAPFSGSYSGNYYPATPVVAPPQPASTYSAAASSHQDLDMYPDSVMSQQYMAYQTFDWLEANPPLYSVPVLSAQPVQNTAGWQNGTQASGKYAGDVHTDSGFGSMLEEEFPEYFNTAIGEIQPG